jgi:hypothetical protein
MSLVARVAVSSVLAAAWLSASEQCGLPEEVIRRLIHYQAWSVFWMGIQPEVPNTQEMKVLRNGREWLVYSVPSRTVYGITESSISSRTCWHSKDWLKCMADQRSPMEASSISDLLLGKVKPAAPVDISSICTFSLTVPIAQTIWRPSEANQQKEQLLKLLGAEVSLAVNHLGTIRDAVSSNFNVDDPQIWVVVDIVEPSGGLDRLLVGVDVHYVVPPRMTVAVVRFGASNENPLVDRILRDPLRLPVKSR